MSYGIVRVQKFSAGSIKGIEIHDRREKDRISHTNKDINWSKTGLNYDLHPQQNTNFQKAIKLRIGQLNLPKAVRKDAVVMAQVLVTSDHYFFMDKSPEQIRGFFSDCYDFLVERYGKENIISAVVHMDETTPHMHFNFVPVTSDGRLSAKSILTRQSLIEQQTAFYEKVGKKYGLLRGMEGSKEKHLEIAELKKQTACRHTEIAIEHLNKIKTDILYLEMDKNALEASVGDLKAISSDIQNLPKGKKAKIGQNIMLTPEEYQQLTNAANANNWEYFEMREPQRKIERLEKRNQELESKSKERELTEENRQLRDENMRLYSRNRELLLKQNEINKAIDRLPISDQQKEQTKLGKAYPIKRNFDMEF